MLGLNELRRIPSHISFLLTCTLLGIAMSACGTSVTPSPVGVSSPAQSATPSVPPGWKVAENVGKGVAIMVPDRWQVWKLDPVADQGFYFLAGDSPASGGHDGALRAVSNGVWKGSKADFVAEMLKPIEDHRTFTNVQLVESIQTSAGEGFEIRFDIIAPKGAEEFEDMYWVFVGDQVIMLDLACPLQYRSEYEGTFRKIAETFSIRDPEALAH